MIGTIVNTATVLLGGTLGVVFKNHISKRFAGIFFQAVGLFTLVLGIKMALEGHEILLIIFSLIAGSFVGEWLKLDKRIESFGDWCKKRLKGNNEQFSEGLITSFLLFCSGSMTILGSIQEGLGQGHELLLTKALMDGFSSLILATTFGAGVAVTAIPLFLFQGGLTLLAMFFGANISMTIITELTAVGGILLIGIAFSILEIKKVKVTNMLPALIFICLFVWCKIHLF
ncbi:MAG: DUF554 domain-containing protein [Bacteroidota bacterium]|nr:DUF554 domain-containing protein [Bacteroidota bacterium]